MRFLKKSYIQRAIREEAQGNYKQAAVYYSKAEEFEKVGEMHELVGDITRAFPAKIRAYQQALRWYKTPAQIQKLAEKLAKTMEVEIRADAKVSAIEHQRLQKVAEYYARATLWSEAGRIYEELGMLGEATEMYVQGGDIEQVEKLSDRQEERNHRTYSAQHYYEDAELAYRLGYRDKAYQALEQCLTIDTKHSRALLLLKQLKQALQKAGRRHIRMPLEECEYILFGNAVLKVGRQEDNDIMLIQHDISRHHARLGFSGQSCIVEDLNSSNGTRLNGLRIQKRAEIRDNDVLSIGRKTRFEVRLRKNTNNVAASLHLLEQEGQQTYYLLFSREAGIGSENECEIPLQHGVSDLPACFFKIKYQQPFWYLHLHPRLTGVELNGVSVEKYVVMLPGDTIQVEGLTFLVE